MKVWPVSINKRGVCRFLKVRRVIRILKELRQANRVCSQRKLYLRDPGPSSAQPRGETGAVRLAFRTPLLNSAPSWESSSAQIPFPSSFLPRSRVWKAKSAMATGSATAHRLDTLFIPPAATNRRGNQGSAHPTAVLAQPNLNLT
jgi:hypothetical protein